MKYEVVSHKNQRLVAAGDAKVVAFDYANNRGAKLQEIAVECARFANLSEKIN